MPATTSAAGRDKKGNSTYIYARFHCSANHDVRQREHGDVFVNSEEKKLHRGSLRGGMYI